MFAVESTATGDGIIVEASEKHKCPRCWLRVAPTSGMLCKVRIMFVCVCGQQRITKFVEVHCCVAGAAGILSIGVSIIRSEDGGN